MNTKTGPYLRRYDRTRRRIPLRPPELLTGVLLAATSRNLAMVGSMVAGCWSCPTLQCSVDVRWFSEWLARVVDTVDSTLKETLYS